MSEQEQLIWVDGENDVIGKISRSEVHIAGQLKLHREAMGFLWEDEAKEKFWLQLRSIKKPEGQFPGYWTLAATCHVLCSDMDENDPLGYVRAVGREAPEEIYVGAKNLELVTVVEMETPRNWSMSGIVEGFVDGVPSSDKDEVDEVRLFDRESVKEIEDKLTPNARRCLIILGILADIPEERV